MRYHYAVWKGHLYMWPACRSAYMVGMMPDPPKNHGLTVIRGNVDCSDCLRMMGGS